MQQWNRNGTNSRGFAVPRAGPSSSSAPSSHQNLTIFNGTGVATYSSSQGGHDDAMEEETDWGDDDEFLIATQMMELDQQQIPPPAHTAAELESLKEIQEFAQWNAQSSQQNRHLPNEELLTLKNKLAELEAANESLKVNNYTLQGEASNLRRRLEVQAAQRQQEVFQKLQSIEETRKRDAQEKRKVRLEQESLKSQLQFARNEIQSLEHRNRQLAKRDSIGKSPTSTQSASSPATRGGISGPQTSGTGSSHSKSKAFPTLKSFFADEVKPRLESKDVQTDDIPAPEPQTFPKTDDDKDIRSQIYADLKSLIEGGAEHEFADVMSIVDAAVLAAPDAFSKDEPMVTVVQGKGLETVDPVQSVFHYLNIRDDDTFAQTTCDKDEYLARDEKMFDVEAKEASYDSTGKTENNSEEDSEEFDSKITRMEDYKVGDAYSTSEDDSDEEIPVESNIAPVSIQSSPSISDPEEYNHEMRRMFECQEDLSVEDEIKKRRAAEPAQSETPDAPVAPDPAEDLESQENAIRDQELELNIRDQELEENNPDPGVLDQQEKNSPDGQGEDLEETNTDPDIEILDIEKNDPDKQNPELEVDVADEDEDIIPGPIELNETRNAVQHTPKAEQFFASSIHLSIRSSLASAGCWVTLNTVRSQLKKLLDSVEAAEEGALFLCRDKLLAFTSLLVWTKHLWRGVSYEEQQPPRKHFKSSEWNKELVEWTPVMIQAVWRWFSSLTKFEQLVRKLFLNTMSSIFRSGHFDHKLKSYERLFLILYDCLAFQPGGKTACLTSTLEILRCAAKSKITYKYICRGFISNTDKCITKLISERTLREFHLHSQENLDQIKIFDCYLSMIEALNEPSYDPTAPLRNDHERVEQPDAPQDGTEPAQKKRRIETAGELGSTNESDPLQLIEKLKLDAKSHSSANIDEAPVESDFLNSDLGTSSEGAIPWLRGSNSEAPSGIRNIACQCRQHLISTLLTMMLEIWGLWGKEKQEFSRRVRIMREDNEQFIPKLQNCFDSLLSRSLDFLIDLYENNNDIAAALGPTGFCLYWRLMGCYRAYKDEVCSEYQKSRIEEMTYDPEDEFPIDDTWADEQFEACKAEYREFNVDADPETSPQVCEQ